MENARDLGTDRAPRGPEHGLVARAVRRGSGNFMHFQSNNDNVGVKLGLTTNGNYVLTGRITGQTRYFSAISTAGGIITAAGTPVSIAPGSKILYVGASDINEASNAYIGELLYYNRALSDIERDQVIAYLRTAWGI